MRRPALSREHGSFSLIAKATKSYNQWPPAFSHRTSFRTPVMYFSILLYLLCVRADFALQVPRQATTSYTDISAPVSTLPSTILGQFCCEIYAPAVALIHWYTGPDPKVLDEVLVTEYLRYNSTFSEIAISNKAG